MEIFVITGIKIWLKFLWNKFSREIWKLLVENIVLFGNDNQSYRNEHLGSVYLRIKGTRNFSITK